MLGEMYSDDLLQRLTRKRLRRDVAPDTNSSRLLGNWRWAASSRMTALFALPSTAGLLDEDLLQRLTRKRLRHDVAPDTNSSRLLGNWRWEASSRMTALFALPSAAGSRT